MVVCLFFNPFLVKKTAVSMELLKIFKQNALKFDWSGEEYKKKSWTCMRKIVFFFIAALVLSLACSSLRGEMLKILVLASELYPENPT